MEPHMNEGIVFSYVFVLRINHVGFIKGEFYFKVNQESRICI